MKAATLIHRAHAALAKTGNLAMVVITSATPFGLTSSLQAGPPMDDAKMVTRSPLEDYHPMYLGTFNTGAKTSDVYTEGNVSFVVPVWSSLGTDGTLGGGMAFITPYVSVGEQGEMASSLGLGWRYLFSDQSVNALRSGEPAGFLTEGFYIGANVFVDNLRTHFDNDFWQLGIGAEIGSRYIELRGNYYLPFDSSEKLAERRTDTQTYTTRSTSRSAGTVNSVRADAPIASGNTLQQDAYLTTTAVTATRTTTTRTTVTTVTELYEEGMEGWDLEAAFLIPGIDRYLDVTLLAGYYSFDNQPFGPQRGGSGTTEGFKAGLEIRPVPAVVLTGMWYEDEGLTGSDWVAGIGLQIPLSKDWMDAFKPRRRHLIERLAEPVARQNAAIKTSLSYDQKRDVKQTSSTQTAVARRVVTQSQQRITIAEDVIFVNNGGDVGNGIEAGSSLGDGTAENPLNTIQAGADLAGNNNVSTQRIWNVYTQGAGAHGGSTYNESITISASTNFISSASLIGFEVTGINGTGDRPWVNGGFANANAFLNGSTSDFHVGIDGYGISGGYQSSASAPQVPVVPNADANGDGIHLTRLWSTNVVDNVITNTDTGIAVTGFLGFNMQTNLAYNKVMDNTGNGINLFISDTSAFTGNIVGNIVSNNGNSGIHVSMVDVGTWSGSVVGNQANDNEFYGIDVEAVPFVGNIRNNTTNDNALSGLRWTGGSITGDVHANTASNNGSDGLHINNAVNGDVYNNIVKGNTGHGMMLSSGDIHHNLAESNGGSGILLTVINGDIYSNIASNNGLDGITIQGALDGAGDIWGNLANDNEGHGINLELSQSSSSGGDFAGNFYSNSTGNNNLSGININLEGDFTGDIYSNQMVGNSGSGIAVTLSHAFGLFNGDVYTNVAISNAGSGIFIDSTGGVVADITNNYASGNGVYGIHVKSRLNMESNVSGNIISGGSLAGLYLYSATNLYGDIHHNTVANVQGDGIYIGAYEHEYVGNVYENVSFSNTGSGMSFFAPFSTLKGDIYDNTLVMNGGNGLDIQIVNGMQGNIIGNEIRQNAGNGIITEMLGGMNGQVANNIVSENGLDGMNINQGPGAYVTLPNIEIANNTVSENGGSGIVLAGVTEGSIHHNIIYDNTLHGIHVAGELTGDVYNNAVAGNGGNGILIGQEVSDPSSSLSFEGNVYGNTTNGNDLNGILINGAVAVTGDIYNNTSNGNDEDGIAINLTFDNGISDIFKDFTGDIYNNELSGNLANGLSMELFGDFRGNIANNEAIGNEGHGIYAYLQFSDFYSYGGEFIGNISDNATHDNGGSGIYVFTLNKFSGNVFNNEAHTNGSTGVSVGGQEGLFGNLNNNYTDGNSSGGIAVTGAIIGSVYSNASTNNSGHGISFTAQGLVDADIYGNVITGNTGDGIYIRTFGGRFPVGIGIANYQGDIYSNVINDNGGTAINVRTDGEIISNVTGNQIIGNGAGIKLDTDILAFGLPTAGIQGSVQNNILLDNSGIGIQLITAGEVAANVSGNYVVNSGADGIQIVAGLALPGFPPSPVGFGSVNGNITSNVIAGSGGNGLSVNAASTLTGSISSNTISTSMGDGIYIQLGGLNGEVSSNISIQNQGAGIIFTSSDDINGDIQNNTTSNNIGSGFIFTEGINPITFSGGFNGNTSNLNGGFGFSTDISILAPGGGPYSPNTAAGNALGNFNNVGAPVANP